MAGTFTGMLRRLLSAIAKAVTPFTVPVRIAGDGVTDTTALDPASGNPATAGGTWSGSVSFTAEDLAELDRAFARSAAAYAPAHGDVAAVRALLNGAELLGCDHDAERGSLRLETRYGAVVAATPSADAADVAARFVPGASSVLIAGAGDRTNIIFAGPGWERWIRVSSLSFDPSPIR